MRYQRLRWTWLWSHLTIGELVQAEAETRTVTNGLEVHETALILRRETPAIC